MTYENKVYVPFEEKRDAVYKIPLFYDDMIYFLQVGYDNQTVNLYCVSFSVANPCLSE